MLENAGTMFDDMLPMMKKLKKTSYENHMKVFREKYNRILSEMTSYAEESDDTVNAAKAAAGAFADCVQLKFARNGKISGRTQADLNFFMIYYVFPAILLTDSPCAKQIADAVCEEWHGRFKDSNIRYADYDTIYGAFRDKIFGIF